ncbi:MAG: energy transducer TonB [Zetaproteobacteria bacterium]|nr:energy transducer TonB [Flavobacteriales bacterium]
MEIKKNARARLENYSVLFLQLGLALALLVTYLALNIKSFDRSIDMATNYFMPSEVIEEIPLIQKPEIIEVVKNNTKIEEAILQSTETNENVAINQIVKSDNINEVVEEEVVAEDIPFAVIEEVPVFPGCKGTKAEKRDCFNAQVNLLVQKNFKSNLAQDLGLAPGIKKIFVLFTIDKNGDIVNIKVRAPHKSLENEAERVIKLLPKITPGRQRNRAVNVSYALPIAFKVLEN